MPIATNSTIAARKPAPAHFARNLIAFQSQPIDIKPSVPLSTTVQRTLGRAIHKYPIRRNRVCPRLCVGIKDGPMNGGRSVALARADWRWLCEGEGADHSLRPAPPSKS